MELIIVSNIWRPFNNIKVNIIFTDNFSLLKRILLKMLIEVVSSPSSGVCKQKLASYQGLEAVKLEAGAGVLSGRRLILQLKLHNRCRT